uniref:Holliday junction resolvase RuvC n=1 Tax=viral metagenome TaxID=1070528 RepID=A0A6M3K1Y6_9ZZZZ
MVKKLTAEQKREKFKVNSRVLKRFIKTKNIKLGIDLGTILTGVYCSDFGSLLIEGGNGKIIERIIRIDNVLLQNLKAMKYKKTIAIIEDYAYQSKMTQMAEISGVIKTSLFKLKIPYLLVATTTIKKFVLGPSRGAKTSKKYSPMLMETLDRWGVKFVNDDLCDSYCMVQFLEYLEAFLFNKKVIDHQKQRDLFNWEKDMFFNFVVNRGEPVYG